MALKRLSLVQSWNFVEFKKIPYLDVAKLVHFPVRAASILFFPIFGHKTGVLKSPESCKEKSCKVTCFW